MDCKECDALQKPLIQLLGKFLPDIVYLGEIRLFLFLGEIIAFFPNSFVNVLKSFVFLLIVKHS